MANEILGKLTNVEGYVNIREADGTIRPAAAGEVISEGQIVTTGSGSSATIEFSNGCEIVLGANEQSLMDKTLLASEGLLEEDVTVAEESVNDVLGNILGSDSAITLESTAAGFEDEESGEMAGIEMEERKDERGEVRGETSELPDATGGTTPSQGGGTDSIYESILTSLAGDDTVSVPEADTTPPVPPTLTIAGTSYESLHVTNDNTPTFSGTGEPGSTIIIYDDYSGAIGRGTMNDGRVILGEVIVGEDGTWTYTSDPLDDGKHIISVESEDAAGNRSAAAEIATLIIDTVAPDAPVIDNLDELANLGLVVSGTAEAGSEVTVTVGDTVYTVTADENGDWSVTTGAMGEGTYAVTATATDEAGNVSDPSSPSSVTLTEANVQEPAAPAPEEPTPEEPVVEEPVDTTAPTVTVDPIDITNSDSPTISGTVDDTDATVTVTVDGESVDVPVDSETGEWSITLDGLEEGDHSVTVTATDSAGNTATEEGSFIVDLSAPDAPVLDFGGMELTNSATPTFSGTAEPGSTVTVYDGDEVLGSIVVDETGTFTFTTPPLADGTHVLTAEVTDPAGNVSGTSDPVTIIIDTTAPELSTPTIDLTDTDNPTINGTINDANATITVDVDGTEYEATIDPETGEWSLTLDPLAEGEHTVTITATDEAGNTSDPVSTTLTVDAESEEPGDDNTGDDTPAEEEDDGNNGNGNDENKDDPSNPGQGNNDKTDDDTVDDGNNGNGNDADHDDPTNPGQGDDTGHGHHHHGGHGDHDGDGHHGHHGILDDDRDRFDFDHLNKEKTENGKEDHKGKDKLPGVKDVLEEEDDAINLGEGKHGHDYDGDHQGGHHHGGGHAESDGGCGGYTPQPDFGLDDNGNMNNNG